jgi:hypothetical protein
MFAVGFPDNSPLESRLRVQLRTASDPNKTTRFGRVHCHIGSIPWVKRRRETGLGGRRPVQQDPLQDISNPHEGLLKGSAKTTMSTCLPPGRFFRCQTSRPYQSEPCGNGPSYSGISVPLTTSLSTTGPIFRMLACMGQRMCAVLTASRIQSSGAVENIRVSTTKSLKAGSTPSHSP